MSNTPWLILLMIVLFTFGAGGILGRWVEKAYWEKGFEKRTEIYQSCFDQGIKNYELEASGGYCWSK